ncbi:proton channel OtopLc-like isoform X2 [Littorina saxatilis]|uniref:Otopetrin-2 n=1 Tax=Littorina saxatilis TaxID=31220 RepID=A0AAN9AQE4_9CAEN
MGSLPKEGNLLNITLEVPAKTELTRNSHSFNSLDNAVCPNVSSNHSFNSLHHGSLNNIEEDREGSELSASSADSRRSLAEAPHETATSGAKSALKSVLKTLRRGSKDVHSPEDGGSSSPPLGRRGRRKSSIFNNMLRRVSIHRKESTPNGRIATFFFGNEKYDDDENGNAGTNGMGGGTDEVTKRHPPKSQNSILLNSLFMILSGLYGILIVVLGAVIPLTEIFVTGEAAAFEYFYLYLYGVSIIFLGYVYVYLLRRKRLQTEFIARTLSRSVSFTRGFATSFLQRQNSDKGRHRKRMVSLDESNHHTGTFYLRLGVLGFGIGSMIHSGLNFGKFFGSITNGQCSNGVSVLLKPLLHLIFTFSQLYFIFMNSKMCIHRYKVVARFGLMHMAATNICVWFRSIVVETLHEIHHHHVHAHDEHHDDDLHHLGDDLRHLGTDHASDHTEASYDNLHTDTENVTVSLGRKLFAVAASAVNGSGGASLGGLLEMRCSWDNMMGKAVDSAGPYLYPCTIEYSLMCAGILYVMWNNVGTRPRRRTDSEMEDDDEGDERVQRMSVDCTSSSRGLFLGIFLTVGAIISIIAFYVMVGQPHLKSQALLLTHLSETVIYFVTVFALVMASLKMRQLVFHVDHKSDLEETLIIIAYTGLLAFNIFSLIAAILMAPAEGAALTIMSNFTMMLQSALQTIFMLAGDRMSASNALQERKKPGREYVTFLLLCNFAMWMINTFETQKPEHNPLQVLFYGPEAWSIFSHISVPLGIYYRFHSTVCLSNIWKNAWKFRKHQH